MLSTEEQQILNFFDSYNVDRIVNYHNEIKRLFHNEICYINKSLDDISTPKSTKSILKSRKERYLRDYYPQMIVTNFLMMYSYLEENLFLIRGRHLDTIDLKKRKGSIGRFKKIIENIDKNLTATKEWQFFIKSQRVRDCLLHANGRVDMIKTEKNKLALESIVASSKGSLNIELKRIRISANYLSEFVKNIQSFQQLVK